jgi:hypothetical protein
MHGLQKTYEPGNYVKAHPSSEPFPPHPGHMSHHMVTRHCGQSRNWETTRDTIYYTFSIAFQKIDSHPYLPISFQFLPSLQITQRKLYTSDHPT